MKDQNLFKHERSKVYIFLFFFVEYTGALCIIALRYIYVNTSFPILAALSHIH